jgi:hypothetical protein
MQHQKHPWRTGWLRSRRPPLLVLLSATLLLLVLALAGPRSSARAAPRSGALSFTIVNITGNILTLQFDGWLPGETITLRYSAVRDCVPSTALSGPDASFSASSNSFETQYTWPSSGIPAGTYYLCATGTQSGGPVPSQQSITVGSNGALEPAPSPTTSPLDTGTPASGSTTPTSASNPGASPSVAPGNGSTPGAPGNKGTSSSTSNPTGGTLIALILICLLVLGLLAYLIRIWLQGRQSGGQPPAGGGQPGP